MNGKIMMNIEQIDREVREILKRTRQIKEVSSSSDFTAIWNEQMIDESSDLMIKAFNRIIANAEELKSLMKR